MNRQEIIQRHRSMVAYKLAGHTHKEVAEHFCVSDALSYIVCKGIAPQDPVRRHPEKFKGADKQSLGNVEEMIAKKIPGFEYAGNYTGSNGTVQLLCKKCGAIITSAWVTVRHGKTSCPACRDLAVLAKEYEAQCERDMGYQLRQEKKKRAAEDRKRRKAENTHPCVICGKPTTNKYTCSTVCSNKRHNQMKVHRRRIKEKAVTIDKGITLEKLYERDKGVCHICGGHCDWEDYEKRGDTFIAGLEYPSIDHVIPLAKGGPHSWDNVKLAHHYCNTLKRDNIAPSQIPA